MVASLTFACPRCKGTFEFDLVGEYELVPCPICGAQFMTIRKGQKMILEAFEFKQATQKISTHPTLTIELTC